MALGRKTGGRKKGTPNKASKTVKDNVLAVFENIGGAATMTNWARQNQTEFFKLYAKLLPTETDLNVEGSLSLVDVLRAGASEADD